RVRGGGVRDAEAGGGSVLGTAAVIGPARAGSARSPPTQGRAEGGDLLSPRAAARCRRAAAPAGRRCLAALGERLAAVRWRLPPARRQAVGPSGAGAGAPGTGPCLRQAARPARRLRAAERGGAPRVAVLHGRPARASASARACDRG